MSSYPASEFWQDFLLKRDYPLLRAVWAIVICTAEAGIQ